METQLSRDFTCQSKAPKRLPVPYRCSVSVPFPHCKPEPDFLPSYQLIPLVTGAVRLTRPSDSAVENGIQILAKRDLSGGQKDSRVLNARRRFHPLTVSWRVLRGHYSVGPRHAVHCLYLQGRSKGTLIRYTFVR